MEQGGRTALIGYSGFVGSNIARRFRFDDLYNTSNIGDIAGAEYDLVVSAAGRADSHRINEAPEEDREELASFADLLAKASIEKLVHVSTVCVYGAEARCDEDTVSDPADLTPYGRNRLELERTLSERFDTISLRLPQLFGSGIKKGLVYDLANDYRVEFIRPDGIFQYYDLSRLWADIEIALDAGLEVLNLATEPIEHRRVALEAFGRELEPADGVEESPFSAMYTRDMITKHAELFGGTGVHIMSADDELEAMRRFVREEFDLDLAGNGDPVAS